MPKVEKKERRKLVRELEKERVMWQLRAEREWLAGVLANKKALAPLQKFLKTTEVGEREVGEREVGERVVGEREVRERESREITEQARTCSNRFRRGIPKGRDKSKRQDKGNWINKGQKPGWSLYVKRDS